jgi:hypothetical protein
MITVSDLSPALQNLVREMLPEQEIVTGTDVVDACLRWHSIRGYTDYILKVVKEVERLENASENEGRQVP